MFGFFFQGDHDLENNEDESFTVPIEEIAEVMSPARDQVGLKKRTCR